MCDQVKEVEVEHTTCEKAKKSLYIFHKRDSYFFATSRRELVEATGEAATKANRDRVEM